MRPGERHDAIFASRLDSSAKFVLLALSSHLADDPTAWCWPGAGRLQELTGLGERTIQGVMGWLTAPEVGVVEVYRAPGRPAQYRIDWSQLASSDLPPRLPGAMQGTPPTRQPPQERHPRRSGTPAGAAPTPAGAAPTPAGAADRTDHDPTSDPTRNRPLPPDAGARVGSGSVVVDGVEIPSDLPALLGADQRAIGRLLLAGVSTSEQLVAIVQTEPGGWWKSGIGAPVAELVHASLRRHGVAIGPGSVQGPPSRASPPAKRGGVNITDLLRQRSPD